MAPEMAAADTEPQKWGEVMRKVKIIVVVIVTVITVLVLTSKVAA